MRTNRQLVKTWMMTTSIEMYWSWLVGLVDDGRAYQHPMLFRIAWDTRYTYTIKTDKNRYMDGIELREEFERESSIMLPDLGPCTVLEFLVALSRRIEYILYDYDNPLPISHWFWRMMENLGLGESDDPSHIMSAFTILVNRKYDYDGEGGLFPLVNPRNDQRKIEVWYQMHSWISELNNNSE